MSKPSRKHKNQSLWVATSFEAAQVLEAWGKGEVNDGRLLDVYYGLPPIIKSFIRRNLRLAQGFINREHERDIRFGHFMKGELPR